MCAWFCVSWSVLLVLDWCRSVQCQHATFSERLQQHKGCTNRLQMCLAPCGRHFGSARHGNADPALARGTCVHGVESDWSGVCAWFCVSWSVLAVSDWCRSVQSQHVILCERLQQHKGCTIRLQMCLAPCGRHLVSARHGNADPAPARGTSVHVVDSDWSGVCAWYLCFLECAGCFRLVQVCPVLAFHPG